MERPFICNELCTSRFTKCHRAQVGKAAACSALNYQAFHPCKRLSTDLGAAGGGLVRAVTKFAARSLGGSQPGSRHTVQATFLYQSCSWKNQLN